MMAAAVGGQGGPALGNHLGNIVENEEARAGSSRGIMAEGTESRIQELTDLVAHSGHKDPLRHVWASPPDGHEWDDGQWDKYWSDYERILGLEHQPYAEAVHDKHDKQHRHRVYSLVPDRGTLVRMGHDYAKHEALNRLTEFETGTPLVKGRHNRRAVQYLQNMGREDVAAAVIAAGLTEGPRPVAALHSKERMQQQRTGISKTDVAAQVVAAWRQSDNGESFRAALMEHGLVLANGHSELMVLDGKGGPHALGRMMNMHAKGTGQSVPDHHAIQNRTDGMDLPSVDNARQAIKNFLAVPVIQAAEPHPVPPSPRPDTSRDEKPKPSATSESPLSRDARIPATPAISAGGESGPSASDTGGASASLADAGDGPGEPPGPGASPDELARYRAKLSAYEERKGAAWAAWVSSQSGQKPSGGSHGTVQNETAGASAVSTGIKADIRQTIVTGESWQGSRADRQWSANPGGDEGGAPNGADGRKSSGGNDASDRGREWPVAGSEDVAGNDMYEAGDHGRTAFHHRIALARATRALGSLNVSEMLDRLEPDRIVRRVIEQEDGRIMRRRAEAPFPEPSVRDADLAARVAKSAIFAPMHKAQDELKLALAGQEAVSPVPWTARITPWETPAERDHRQAREAVIMAHAAVAAATPSRDRVDDAVFLARTRADNAARAYTEWQRGTGQELDRTEHLLAGIAAAMDGGDRLMRRAVLDGGVAAGMRLQAEREAAAEQERSRMQAEQSNVVGFRPR